MTRLGWAAFVLAAAATGVLSVKPAMRWTLEHTAIHNGPWRTTAGTGSTQAGLHERAAVAVGGLYALSGKETVYFTAFVDSSGETLRGSCSYMVSGTAPEARWWSLTIYGDDNYLVPNVSGIYSRHANSLELEADHRFIIAVSAQTQPRNWLPSPDQGPFSITLRLYNPGAAVFSNPDRTPLPRIERGSCT